MTLDVAPKRLLGVLLAVGLPVLFFWALAESVGGQVLAMAAATIALTLSILGSRVLEDLRIDLTGTRFQRTAEAVNGSAIARTLTRSTPLRVVVAGAAALIVAILEAPIHSMLTPLGWGEPVTGLVSLALLLAPLWFTLSVATYRGDVPRTPGLLARIGVSLLADLGRTISRAGRYESAAIFAAVHTTIGITLRALLLAVIPYVTSRPLLLVAVAALAAAALIFGPDLLATVRRRVEPAETEGD